MFLFLNVFSILLWAQDVDYFSSRFDFTGQLRSDGANSLFENENAYIVLGYTRSDIYPYWDKVIMLMNKDGSVKQIKTIGDGMSDYFFGNPGSIIRFNDTTYYTIGSKRIYTTNWVHDRGMLICYDKRMDTLWSSYYGEKSEPYDTAFLLYQLKKSDQNNLVIVGGWKPMGQEIRIWLAKTDNLGNLIWEKSFGSGTGYYQGHSVVQTTDGGYAIGGFLFYIGNDNSGDPILIKTNSQGNQQWMKNLGGPYKDYKAMICLDNEGNMIVGTNYADYMSGDEAYTRINIIKLDTLGNILWNKKYGTSRYRNYLVNIRSLEDGDIIATGTVGTFFPWRSGWIIKVNSQGDSIWYREYSLFQGENSMNFLYDLIQTSDNGLLACGYVYPSAPDTGSQDAWVIKLDSIGCEFPFCDTTVGMDEITGAEKNSLLIYPNPASNIINCRLQVAGYRPAPSNAEGLQASPERSRGAGDFRLVIYDIFGRKAEEIVIPPWQETVQMDVSGWNAGVYVAVLWGEDGVVGREKFVVTH